MTQNIDISRVTTLLEIPGHRLIRSLGLVHGLSVRSQNVVGDLAAGIQSLFGGEVTPYKELCENTRQEATHLLVQAAAALGANAVVGVRYDANEVINGITEVFAYGTAVLTEPVG